MAWTAAGSFDGYFELNLNTWDVAAGAALVREVGGKVSDWSGGDTWVEAGNIFAAQADVHEVLGRMALERMLGGLSTRRYPVGLEPVGSTSAEFGLFVQAEIKKYAEMVRAAGIQPE